MPLRTQLTDQIKDAMRNKDTVALDALRFMLSKIKNIEIEVKHELNDQEFVSAVQKEVKMRRESIEQFLKAGRKELADREQGQLEKLVSFLPKQLSPEEVEKEIKAIVESAPVKEFNVVIRDVMAKLKGKADGKSLADQTRKLLGQ
ncbi:MAG TPA: GatB/YqeY domain-containing protein [Candidatus Saccharimonadia bacterium]|nr:GatB/YqeY domain-containing protein [Candidatus Saccharimonadia bacterium]